MVFSGTRFIVVGRDEFPPFELDIEILTSFSKNIDEGEVVVEGSLLVLASKAEDSFHSDSVSQVAF